MVVSFSKQQEEKKGNGKMNKMEPFPLGFKLPQCLACASQVQFFGSDCAEKGSLRLNTIDTWGYKIQVDRGCPVGCRML